MATIGGRPFSAVRAQIDSFRAAPTAKNHGFLVTNIDAVCDLAIPSIGF
jgi:hypothetical protein